MSKLWASDPDAMSGITYGFNAYQTKAVETYSNRKFSIFYPGFKLAGEAGECAEKIGKCLRDNDGVFSDEIKAALAKEIGDVLWYCAALADDLGLILGDIAVGNLEKVHDRKARGVLHGSGDNR